MGPSGSRRAWLSITPEPERELPEALATLRAGGPPPRELVERERALAEKLVTRGARRAWIAYLEQAVALARSAQGGEEVAAARVLIEDVIENHESLALGLARRRTTRRTHGNGESA